MCKPSGSESVSIGSVALDAILILDWANESREQALGAAYNKEITSTGILTKVYIQRARDIIELRLLQVGVRLAHLLNTKLN